MTEEYGQDHDDHDKQDMEFLALCFIGDSQTKVFERTRLANTRTIGKPGFGEFIHIAKTIARKNPVTRQETSFRRTSLLFMTGPEQLLPRLDPSRFHLGSLTHTRTGAGPVSEPLDGGYGFC